MKFKTVLAAVIGLVAACCFQQRADAGQTNVAVAANFTEAAKEIATAFKAKTGHDAVLSFGATGQFYTQITQERAVPGVSRRRTRRARRKRSKTASPRLKAGSPTPSASSCCGARIPPSSRARKR